jgi:hypothetical protein
VPENEGRAFLRNVGNFCHISIPEDNRHINGRGNLKSTEWSLMWHIDPLLCRDLETDNKYSRCYAIGW